MANETTPGGPSDRGLVVGFDPEHGGPDALQLGRLFCEVLAARPRVVTAVPWPRHLIGSVEIEKELAAETRRRFAEVEAQLADLGAATEAVASRNPAHTLQEIAERDGATMIVVASSHRGKVSQTLAGSVGESLLHGAPCAVAIAPRGYAESPGGRLQRLAVAYDGSPESRIALETAIGLAERCHAQLTALTVADRSNYTYAAAWTVLSAGDLRTAEHAEKTRLLEEATGLIPDEIERDGRVLVGDPGVELRQASGEFDLVVAGSRSWGPVRRTVVGSTTRTLIRASACPVLVLPRGTGPDPLGLRTGSAAAS
jgi:nucleotide-binding universal stress UspA family protein